MKKQILLLFVTVSSLTAFAQPTISFGVKAGLSSAGIRGDAIGNLNNLLEFTNGMVATKNRKGIFLGGYANIPLTEQISVEPGLYYSQKGYELKGNMTIKALSLLGINAKTTLQSDYIDMPVLLKATVGNGFQVFAGPQVSYLTRSQLKSTAGILGINLLKNTTDLTNQFNRWDIGATAGVGYQLNGGLNISASYDYGLSKIDANNSLKGFNHAIKLGIGFTF